MELGPMNTLNNSSHISNNFKKSVTTDIVDYKNNTENTSDQQQKNLSETNHTQSFVYGALGINQPDGTKTDDNTAYTAGQVLKAIGTVGSIIAIII